MSAQSVTIERVVDKLRELEARVRALERMAEDDRTLDDIRASISMIADSVASPHREQPHREQPQAGAPQAGAPQAGRPAEPPRHRRSMTALHDPRFRAL